MRKISRGKIIIIPCITLLVGSALSLNFDLGKLGRMEFIEPDTLLSHNA
jgi:hypothetical protein